jgi:hypothetical protein
MTDFPPFEIIQAAENVNRWYKERGVDRWKLGSVMSRDMVDSWMGAVLDQLALTGMDAPIEEKPEMILKRIIEWNVSVSRLELIEEL